jgi:hypothetical protein
MPTCGACGRWRPDSQTDCDCGAKHRSKWLIYYGISLCLTALIELSILEVRSNLASAELAGGPMFAFMVLCVIGASAIYLLAAAFWYRRGTRWGWLLAIGSVAVWAGTLKLVWPRY